MFGINDWGIILAYLLAVCCLLFSIWWGITHWNKDYKSDSEEKTMDEYKHDDKQ
ncbi:MAG: hypothetical protein Q4F97_02510 [Bacteroidales bacterium]|nr:hypothetical protein [Bacteroidales bacterium]